MKKSFFSSLTSQLRAEQNTIRKQTINMLYHIIRHNMNVRSRLVQYADCFSTRLMPCKVNAATAARTCTCACTYACSSSDINATHYQIMNGTYLSVTLLFSSLLYSTLRALCSHLQYQFYPPLLSLLFSPLLSCPILSCPLLLFLTTHTDDYTSRTHWLFPLKSLLLIIYRGICRLQSGPF